MINILRFSTMLRLTFWLSNTVVMREIVSQAFGGSRHGSTRLTESNGNGKRSDTKSTTLKWKGSPGTKQINGLVQFSDDWQETGTFTAALEKVESWIFSRVVESVWWQVNHDNFEGAYCDDNFCELVVRLLSFVAFL